MRLVSVTGIAGIGQSRRSWELQEMREVLAVDRDPRSPVIDWANAARGDPDYDVADTWVLFAPADVPEGRHCMRPRRRTVWGVFVTPEDMRVPSGGLLYAAAD